jgi:TolB-like protein
VDPKKFFAELQRRNVYKVAIAYGVVGWLLIQVATQLFPVFEIPNWGARMAVVIVLLGFPVALVLAWAYELTPEGLQRTDEVPPQGSITRRTGRKLDFIIIGVLLTVIAVMAFQHYRTGGLNDAAQKSIAILPFIDLSETKEQDYFSDGVTGDIITELARWRLLSVPSRAASFQYRGGTADIKQIARELNVRYVVEGSIRRIGGRIRITVQLIDAVTGNHVWAEKFDREITEIFAVQDQVVRTIVSTLVGRVMAATVERASRKPPASMAAYECVLKGNALPWDDPAGAKEATRLFAKATEIDPGYRFAHALLANMYGRKWIYDLDHSDAALEEAYKLVEEGVVTEVDFRDFVFTNPVTL